MLRTLAVVTAGLIMSGTSVAQGPSLLEASQAFLKSLGEAQRARVMYEFNSGERLDWHYVPKQRIGLALKDLSPSQQAQVMDVLQAGLSEQGYSKAETIRQLETVLREMEGSARRDPGLYSIVFFGEPTADGNWYLRYEGHHLSFNWTFVNGRLAATSPQFLGANPAEVRIGGPMQGTRALRAEEDLARELVQSLDDDQLRKALLDDEAPGDILTSNQREVAMLEDLGIPYPDLTADQQGVLISVIEELARVMPPDVASARIEKIRAAGIDNVKFAWMGGLERGEAHYYRVQGPTFLIEYDNTQDDANHVHTVWRDFAGDFGRDLLKEHYAEHVDPDRPGSHAH
ncbi:MAG TPA: DUF3500 domain-containing protein [Woeseiaceae bacterium]|nr:DUF3500 domain-containing protein [Woeseiaceae bacterium]